jgi:hypothetical protein
MAGLAAMFALVAVVAVAGQEPRQRRAGGGRGGPSLSPELQTKVITMVAQELGLKGDKAAAFAKAYLAESEARRKQFMELRESGDRDKMREVFTESRKKMQALCEEHFGEDKARMAMQVLGGGGFGGVQRSVSTLVRAEVDEKKLDKALPVIVKHNIAMAEMLAKAREANTPREEITAKRTAMVDETAKALAAIVGEEAANAWKERESSRRFGGRGMGGGRRGGGEGGGAMGGARRGGGSERPAPEAP